MCSLEPLGSLPDLPCRKPASSSGYLTWQCSLPYMWPRPVRQPRRFSRAPVLLSWVCRRKTNRLPSHPHVSRLPSQTQEIFAKMGSWGNRYTDSPSLVALPLQLSESLHFLFGNMASSFTASSPGNSRLSAPSHLIEDYQPVVWLRLGGSQRPYFTYQSPHCPRPSNANLSKCNWDPHPQTLARAH